jgi:hypothetical protein
MNCGCATGLQEAALCYFLCWENSWTVEHAVETFSTIPVGSVRFKALNQVRPNKIKKIFFIFNCVLFEELVLNIIQWHYIN